MPDLFAPCVLALALAQPTVYRCVGADQIVRYQDRPCAEAEVAEAVRLRREAEPPSAASVANAPGSPDPASPAPVQAQGKAPVGEPFEAPMAWRCEVENGEVYFRHDACPPQISEPVALVDSAGQSYATVLVHAVRAVRVSRRLACQEIARGGRLGAERDQRAEAYDKLTGRDPCR